MRKTSTIPKAQIYFYTIYLAIGIVFCSSIYGIYVHGCDVPVKQLVHYKAIDPSQRANALASTPSNSNPNADINYYQFLVATCVLAFALTYVGSPLYQYFTSIKPLGDAIKDLSSGGHLNVSESAAQPGAYRNLQSMATRQSNATAALQAMLNNNFDVVIEVDAHDPLSNALIAVQKKFRAVVEKETLNAMVHTNLGEIDRLLKDEYDQVKLNENLIRQVSKSVDAGVGVLYKWNDDEDDQHFYEVASYGFYDNRHTKRRINRGEGQLGEMAINKRPVFLNNLPKGYLVIQSGLGSATPTDVAIFPLLFKGQLYGALEVALFRPLTPAQVSLLERSSESIGAHFFNYQVNADAKEKLEELARKQGEELVEIHRLQETTLEKLEGKLKEVEDEKIKNESILEGCVDGVITFDHHGSIRFCNNAASEILGHDKKHICNTTIQELLPVIIREDLGVWKPFCVISSREKEISIRTEATLSTSDGGDVDTLVTCTTVDHKGGILFTFFIQKISVDLF